MSLSDRLFCNHYAHPLRQAWSYHLRCAKEVFVWFKSRLNPWYISIPSNPNLYSTKIIMKMRWQTIASSVLMRTISPTATPLPTAYDCVAVYIAGRRTNLVVYGCRPQPTTKKESPGGLSFPAKNKIKISYIKYSRRLFYWNKRIFAVSSCHVQQKGASEAIMLLSKLGLIERWL